MGPFLVCCGRGAAATFEAQVLDSMAKLRVGYLDLFAFHGVNTPKKLGWVTRAGGCLDVARRLQAAGKGRCAARSAVVARADWAVTPLRSSESVLLAPPDPLMRRRVLPR